MTKKRRLITEASAEVYMSTGRLTSDHSGDIDGGSLSFGETHCKVLLTSGSRLLDSIPDAE